MASTSLIQTYIDLQNAAADYLIRSDLTVQIQLAITLAEAEFNRSIRNKRMEQRSTTSTVGGQAYVTLPTDFLEVRSIALVQNPRVPLQYRTPTQLETLYPEQTPRQPQAFCIVDSEFRLAPIPDAPYVIEILYYQQIPSLGSPVVVAGITQPLTTNWLLQNHPDVYLFATLVQVSLITQDTAIGGAASALYQNGMQSLASEEKREQWNGSPLIPTTDTWMR